jgi:hypothetical protein
MLKKKCYIEKDTIMMHTPIVDTFTLWKQRKDTHPLLKFGKLQILSLQTNECFKNSFDV